MAGSPDTDHHIDGGAFPTMWPPNSWQNDNNSSSNISFTCNEYMLKNKTYFIYGGFQGIPENLVINIIVWICLLAFFTFSRKTVWNCCRQALYQKRDGRWTSFFYRTEETEANDLDSVSGEEIDSLISDNSTQLRDTGTFSWILTIFRIKDKHVRLKCGMDAVHYLSFQRHMIVYLTVVCVICIAVILPINFQGTMEGGNKEFGQTTISNLSPSSPFMWVHITLAFLFLPLGIVFTRHHSRQLRLNPTDLDPDDAGPVDSDASSGFVARTLMITNVPRPSCNKETLLRHFAEAYPSVEVHELQFAYSIHDLISKDKEREVVHQARIYCEDYETKNEGERLMMSPYKCGAICSCCYFCGRPKVDALEFYSEEEKRLNRAVESEKKLALQLPTGVAFVTLDSKESAVEILKAHKTMTSRGSGGAPVPAASKDLRPQNWLVRHAPAPNNIYWENISVRTRSRRNNAVRIKRILFVVFIVLAIPAVIINLLQDFAKLIGKPDWHPVLAEFLPSLLLLAVTALMPVLLAYSDQLMSHWTRSALNHAVMRTTFLFLLPVVIILPSIVLTSAEVLAEWIAKPTANNGTYRWECIFLPDSGAFFVNYIISSAFIGTSLELICLPDLFKYYFHRSFMRSKAEITSVRRDILSEFPFGVQYARMLHIFAMTMIYSLSCPLITPFGLLYMVFKHLVDTYNIYFAYGPSRISKNMHATAVNFVMVSIVLLQLCLFFFAFVRLGIKQPRTIYSLTLSCITVLIFIAPIGLNCLKGLSPIEFQSCDASPDVEALVGNLTTVVNYGSTRSNSRLETGVYVSNVLKNNN